MTFKPRISLKQLLAWLLFISAASFAAQTLYYEEQITCSSGTAEDCQSSSGAALSDTMKQLAFELSSSQSPELCSTDPQLGVSCSIDGKPLTCSGHPADGAGCHSNQSTFFSINCQASCSANIDTQECKASPDNEALCNALLPNEQRCALNLSGCVAPQATKVRHNSLKQAITQSCQEQSSSSSDLCGLIDSPDSDQLLAALTPENLDIANDTTYFSQTQLLSYIGQHLQRLRQGSGSTNNNNNQSYYFDNHHQGFLVGQQWAATTGIQSDAISEPAESVINLSQDGRLSMYVNISYLQARQSLSELEGKSKSRTAMLTTGLDYRLHQGVIGGALSIADGNTTYGKNDSNFDSQNYNATLYASLYRQQWWLDGVLNYGINRFNQERDIHCSAASCNQINNLYYANYHGNTKSAQLATGYDFNWGGLSISPYAQWQLGTIKNDAYTEKAKFSGLHATLNIDEQKRDFSTVSLGSYLRYSFATKKAVLVPYLRVLLNRELKDDAQYISGRLVGAANSDFVVRANDRDNSYATIGTGLSMQMQNGHAGFVDLETVEAYDKLSQYQLTTGWRFVF